MADHFGIKHTGTFRSGFEIMKMTLAGESKSKDEGRPYLINEVRQRQWVNEPGTLAAYSFAPSDAPWAHVSAPGQWRMDVQKTIQTYRGMKSSPLLLLDLETTGLDIGSNLFNITEVAMLKSQGLTGIWNGPGSQVMNLAVSPSKENAAVLRSLIRRADRGEMLTKNERYAIASLMRYAGDTIDPVTKTVKRHSDLFSKNVVDKSFTRRQLAAMRLGLMNLERNGVAESEIMARISDFTSDLRNGKATIVGHNMLNFDIPALQKITKNKERWAGLVNSLNNPDVLDTLNLLRMYRSDHSKLYRSLIFNDLVNTKYAGQTITPSLAKKIAKEARTRLKQVDLSDVGPYSLDAMRRVFGLSEGGAHLGEVDLWQLLEVLQKGDSIFTADLFRAKRGKRSYAPPTHLSFSETPMEMDQWFFVPRSQRGTGFDFSMDVEVSGKKQRFSNYGLTRGVYQFKGFYQDTVNDQNVFIAKFFDPNAQRYSFLTGATPDELRQKLHAGRLHFLGDTIPDEIASFPGEILGDYGRRRWDRWGDVARTKGFGWDQMQRFFQALDDPSVLESTAELRDFRILEPKLRAEQNIWNIFRGKVDEAKLSSWEKTFAISAFDKRLDELFAAHGGTTNVIRPTHPWENYVPIFGKNVSLGESFGSQVDRLINAQIKEGVVEPQAERTRQLLLNQMAKDLDAAYGLEGRAITAANMSLPFSERLNKIRNILINSKQVLDEIEYNRVVARDLSFIDVQAAQKLAEEVVTRAKDISRSVAGSYFDQHAHGGRIKQAVAQLYDAYAGAGFGVGIVNLDGHLKMVLTESDLDSVGAMHRALKSGKIPDKALTLEIPTLSELGNIIYGREHKIGTRGFIRGGREVPLYEDIVGSLAKKAKTIRRLTDFQTDLTTPHRILRKTVRERLELASGLSRSSTFDRYEEAFRLDLRGNDMDILRKSFVNVRDMAKEFAGKDWDDLGLYDIIDYINNFKRKAMMHYPNEKWAQDLTIMGIKDQAQLLRGVFATEDARDYMPFGHMIRSLRPNVVQWLNYYSYSADELRERIQELGIKNISLNPLIVSEKGAKTYNILSGGKRALSKGVTIGALEMSSEDLVHALTSEQGKRILRDYGLNVNDVLAHLPGTWEQGAVLSPEMRGLMPGIQPKDFDVAASNLDGFGSAVREFLDKAQKRTLADGSVIYDQASVEIGKTDTLFTERINARGKDVLVPTLFKEAGGEGGRITQVTEFTKDGEKFYRIGTEVDFPMDDATKFMYDTRKMTSNYFGIHADDTVSTVEGMMSKKKASGRAFHKLFGDRVHMIYLSTPEKHLDVGADIAGRLRTVAEQLVESETGRTALEREFTRSFGRANLVQLPGIGGYTLAIPDATELMKHGDPEKVSREVDRIVSTLTEEFDIDLGDVSIGGRQYRRRVVELRRSLINEQKYLTDWTGAGLGEDHGVKITPREIASLKIKGAVLGVDMQPILDYFEAEAMTKPGYKKMQKAAQSMIEAVSALTEPERIGDLPRYGIGDLTMLPTIKGRDYFLKSELEGSIIGIDRTFALTLPEGFTQTLAGGIEISGALPVAQQMLKASDVSGKIFLDDQAKALVRVQEALASYNSFVASDMPHGRAETLTEADSMLRSAIEDYVDALGKDASYSHGRLIENVMSYRLPASGYVKAQNVSANILSPSAMTGEVVISKDLAEEMFGSYKDSPDVWNRLQGEGWYGIVRRDPNETHWNFAVAKYRIDETMGPRTARLSAVEAALMGADFDGDQIALLSPYSKRIAEMDTDEVGRLQLALSKIHRKQTEHTLGVAGVLRESYEKEGRKRGENYMKGYVSYLQEALTEQGGAYSLANFMWGSLHEEQAMLARLAKGSAGPLYNIAHMYREAGLAIYDKAKDVNRIELLDAFTYVTTEPFALKSKHGGKETKVLRALLGDLSRGSNLDLWVEEYAEAIPDRIAASWTQASGVAQSLGGKSFVDLDEGARKVFKTQMAQEMLGTVAHVRRTAEISGAGAYFDYDSVASRMFYSERAYNKHYKHLDKMFREFMDIRPDSADFMERFIPTETWRAFAKGTGQLGAFEQAEQLFRQNVKPGPLPRLDTIIDEVGRKQTIEALSEQTQGVWSKIPSKVKWGAAGLGGLYVLGRGLLPPPEPEEVPQEPVDSQEALIALNNPDESGPRGRKITVKAKNLQSLNLDQIQTAVQQVSGDFGAKGNINIQQRDDTSTINNSWLQELFAGAIRNGRA